MIMEQQSSFFSALLGRGNFLDHDTGHGDVPGVSIATTFSARKISDIYSYSDNSLGNSPAVTSNLSWAVYVEVCSAVVSINMGDGIDGEGTVTFYTIESEEPALTAIQAIA